MLYCKKIIRWKIRPIKGNRANSPKKLFVRPKVLVSYRSKFNWISFTIQSIANYAVISVALTMFQFSTRISRIWMIVNTFNGFTQMNINLTLTINQSNFATNTKTNFINTVNMNINMGNMVMHSTEKVTNQIIGRVTPPEMPTKSVFVYTRFKCTNFRNNFRYNTNFTGTD